VEQAALNPAKLPGFLDVFELSALKQFDITTYSFMVIVP
jgi:hypothetical protein